MKLGHMLKKETRSLGKLRGIVIGCIACGFIHNIATFLLLQGHVIGSSGGETNLEEIELGKQQDERSQISSV